VPKLGWPHIAVILTAIVALVVLVIAASAMSAEQRASLVFEAGKAALIVLTGTVLTWTLQEVVRSRDARRDDAKALREVRRAFRADLLDAYNRAKSLRRTLRAAGLTPAGSWPLTAQQLAQLDAQMESLSEAQLSIERLGRERSAEAARFEAGKTVTAKLQKLEKELNLVVKEWEEERPHLTASDNAERIGSWPTLRGFLLGPESGGTFGAVADLVHSIEASLHPDFEPAVAARSPLSADR
jgi:parvulin-like peptidyl-prolyl isomerase